MKQTEYLYDSSGKWIAFKVGKYLFNTSSDWIGWFPWQDIAVDVEGHYLGTIFLNNRLLVNLNQPWLPYPGYPGYPGYPEYPGYPGFIGYCGHISNTVDIKEEKLRGN